MGRRRDAIAIFLGLDCGGSTSRALAADEKGNSKFQGQSGPANLATTPDRFIRANLQKATNGCPKPAAICGCFAGLLTESDAERATTILKEIFPKGRLSVFPDYAAAHAASEGADFTLIAGTGSVICSRAKGKFVKSGGRGYLFGDEFSAFRFGREAFMNFLNAPKPSDQLQAAVEDIARTRDLEQATANIYRSGSPPARLARLASAFTKDLERGDHYATSFLEVESSRFAEIVAKHIRAYFRGKSRLLANLAGGVWKLSPKFQVALESAVLTAIPETRVSFAPLKKPPVYGALRLATESIDEH